MTTTTTTTTYQYCVYCCTRTYPSGLRRTVRTVRVQDHRTSYRTVTVRRNSRLLVRGEVSVPQKQISPDQKPPSKSGREAAKTKKSADIKAAIIIKGLKNEISLLRIELSIVETRIIELETQLKAIISQIEQLKKELEKCFLTLWFSIVGMTRFELCI